MGLMIKGLLCSNNVNQDMQCLDLMLLNLLGLGFLDYICQKNCNIDPGVLYEAVCVDFLVEPCLSLAIP